MCGIAGQVRNDGNPVSAGLITRMCAAQSHRGPDSRGLHLSERVGLGIQRLRVIDLESGDQPIYNEDRSVAVVLNGEIYNYRELRERLRRSGHRFATRGDTEAIVHLYEEHGVECVEHLHGMFAFALWDSRRRRLLLARDRVGKKPLFYSFRAGVLSFASELGALLRDDEIPRAIDPDAIDAYLAYGYVPAPLSAYRSVRKLPPAHTLVLDDGALITDRYWRLDYAAKRSFAAPGERDEALRAALDAAVARRLDADVPVGAFLSGGIDSSAVVASMARQSPRPVKTFSIGFADEAVNELPRARLVAERFGTDHHELVVEPDAIELLPKLARHYGEPFGDHSALPSFYLAEMAGRQVTVALNGDGGDESFAGYQRYTSNLLAARFDRLPPSLRRAIAGAGSSLGGSADGRALRSRARRFAGRLGDERRQRYLAQVSVFDAAQRRRIYREGFAESVRPGGAEEFLLGPWREASGRELLDQLLEVDAAVYLPGDLLTKVDVASMAHSLEVRSPLLDHELMELAASLPAADKAAGTRRKIALRDALRGQLPDEVLDGPKQGFEIPVGRWLRGELAPLLRETLLDRGSACAEWVDPTAMAGLIDEHVAARADHGRRLWALLALETWARESDAATDEAPVAVA